MIFTDFASQEDCGRCISVLLSCMSKSPRLQSESETQDGAEHKAEL